MSHGPRSSLLPHVCITLAITCVEVSLGHVSSLTHHCSSTYSHQTPSSKDFPASSNYCVPPLMSRLSFPPSPQFHTQSRHFLRHILRLVSAHPPLTTTPSSISLASPTGLALAIADLPHTTTNAHVDIAPPAFRPLPYIYTTHTSIYKLRKPLSFHQRASSYLSAA